MSLDKQVPKKSADRVRITPKTEAVDSDNSNPAVLDADVIKPPVVVSDVVSPYSQEQVQVCANGNLIPRTPVPVRPPGKFVVFGCFDKQIIRELKSGGPVIFLSLSEAESEKLHSLGLCDTIVVSNKSSLPESISKNTVCGVFVGSYEDKVATLKERQDLVKSLQ